MGAAVLHERQVMGDGRKVRTSVGRKLWVSSGTWGNTPDTEAEVDEVVDEVAVESAEDMLRGRRAREARGGLGASRKAPEKVSRRMRHAAWDAIRCLNQDLGVSEI